MSEAIPFFKEDRLEVPEKARLVPVEVTPKELARLALHEMVEVEDGLVLTSEEDESVPEQIEQVRLTVDPIRDYLHAIGKYRLINAQQEVELARAVEVGVLAQDRKDRLLDEGVFDASVEIQELKELQRTGERSRARMANANLRLVVNLAKRYQNRGLSLLDLIQEGNLGLMHAIDKFDYTKGFKFSTYATWWIRQGILRAIADKGNEIRIPVHMNEQIIKIARAERDLSVELERKPTEKEVAYELEIPVEKIRELQSYDRKLVSLNEKIGEDGETEFGDLISDEGAMNPENNVELNGREEAVNKLLETLNDTEAMIIRYRFGLGGVQPKTINTLADQLGLNRQSIQRIEKSALQKLRVLTATNNSIREYLA